MVRVEADLFFPFACCRATIYLFGRRMAAEWKVGNHLLIGKLISLRALNHTIQNQDIPICFTANVGVNQRRTTTRQ